MVFLMNTAEDPPLKEVAPGIWTLEFPFRLAGMAMERRVTIVRLRSGRVLIHSTGPFTPETVAAIRALGEPVALVEGTLFHDTFATAGRQAFPDVPYFAPGNDSAWNQGARPLAELPERTGDEIAVEPIDGVPAARENVVIHPDTSTAIVCDLIFNIQPPQPVWTALAFKYINGCYGRPGMTRLFRSMIRDKAAFRASVRRLLAHHHFERLIPGHGQILSSGAMEILQDEIDRF